MLWQQKVALQRLVIDQLRHSPVLLFASRRYVRNRKPSYNALKLLLRP